MAGGVMNGRSLMVYGGLFLMFGLGMIAREAVVRLQARSLTAVPAAAQTAASPVRIDIDTGSGNRLPVAKRESLDELGQTLYDKIAADARSGRSIAGFKGPYGIALYSPRVADADQRKNDYLRFDSSIGRRFYEVAVLVTARELDHQFEWTAHEPAALKAGVEQAVIDVIKYRRPLGDLQPKDAAIIQLGRELLRRRAVESKTFAEALTLFGPKELVDVVSVIGNYSAIAVLLNAFDQQLAPGQQPLLPRN
jgi:4-carboxymuconolactone decarboxylase